MSLPNFNRTVAVLFGGRSSEHEISLRSAVFVLKNIPLSYNIIPVGIDRNGVFHSLTGTFTSQDFNDTTLNTLEDIVLGKVPSSFLNSQNVVTTLVPLRREVLDQTLFKGSSVRLLNLDASCIFPVLHGPNGEDGRLQGLFELADMAYVGCSLRASVIGIDKDLQKRIAKEAGIAVAKYAVVDREEFQQQPKATAHRIASQIGYPCFVKPNAMGSAVGAGKAKNQEDLLSALKEALAFDQKALVEELLVGTEVECAFLGSPTAPRISIAGEVAPKEFYSYEEKYGAQSQTALYIPARLTPARMAELQSLSIKIAQSMGLEGLCRIDFWNLSTEQKFIFNEINTLPGLTSISMFPKLWEQEGITGPVWLEEVIQKAYKRKALFDELQFGVKAQV